MQANVLLTRAKSTLAADNVDRLIRWVLLPAGAALAWGVWRTDVLWLIVGGGLVAAVAFRLGWFDRLLRRSPSAPARGTATPPKTSLSRPVQLAVRRAGSDGLIEGMIDDGRYALLLRPQVVDNLNESHLQQTVRAMQENMALIPAGQVVLGQLDAALADGRLDEEEIERHQGRLVQVEPAFLDRCLVTNRQFQRFVDGGGYEDLAIWDEEVLPALLEFVDATGQPGPRYWKSGRCEAGREDHPVVGVSWYEACAYARWVGKRLPTDAEWCKAACWPVVLGSGSWLQRKFPWGNLFEPHRANTWNAAQDDTVSVHEFAEGCSVGGVQQLIGNVWEWMSSPFGRPDEANLALPVPMKSIRGGAYDTYFENQATCQFLSGDNPLARKHNIGFRLALGACDLAVPAAELLLGGLAGQESNVPAEEVTV